MPTPDPQREAEPVNPNIAILASKLRTAIVQLFDYTDIGYVRMKTMDTLITTTLTTVRQQEREACATVAYNYRYAEKCLDPHHDERYCQTCLLRGDGADIASEQIAAAIRARGQG